MNQNSNLTMLHQRIQNSRPTVRVLALSATAGGAYYLYKKRSIGNSPASPKSSNPIHESTTGKEPDSNLPIEFANTAQTNRDMDLEKLWSLNQSKTFGNGNFNVDSTFDFQRALTKIEIQNSPEFKTWWEQNESKMLGDSIEDDDQNDMNKIPQKDVKKDEEIFVLYYLASPSL